MDKQKIILQKYFNDDVISIIEDYKNVLNVNDEVIKKFKNFTYKKIKKIHKNLNNYDKVRNLIKIIDNNNFYDIKLNCKYDGVSFYDYVIFKINKFTGDINVFGFEEIKSNIYLNDYKKKIFIDIVNDDLAYCFACYYNVKFRIR